jgi:hypothetical protein
MKKELLLYALIMGAVALYHEELSAQGQQKNIGLATHEVSLGSVHPGILTESLVVSPDGQHLAYVAQRGLSWLVVLDGIEGKEYDGIMKGSPIFSSDGKHLAYAAQVGTKLLVVVDGKESVEYDGIGDGTLLFSPDCKHFAYQAVRGLKCLIVVDGKEGEVI